MNAQRNGHQVPTVRGSGSVEGVWAQFSPILLLLSWIIHIYSAAAIFMSAFSMNEVTKCIIQASMHRKNHLKWHKCLGKTLSVLTGCPGRSWDPWANTIKAGWPGAGCSAFVLVLFYLISFNLFTRHSTAWNHQSLSLISGSSNWRKQNWCENSANPSVQYQNLKRKCVFIPYCAGAGSMCRIGLDSLKQN